jgi:hypothetical protein
MVEFMLEGYPRMLRLFPRRHCWQQDIPSRAEAARRLIELSLKAAKGQPAKGNPNN